MNADTKKLEQLTPSISTKGETTLLRPDGSKVPSHWTIFTKDELVTVKDHTFRIAHLGESYLVLEPITPQDTVNLLDALKGENQRLDKSIEDQLEQALGLTQEHLKNLKSKD